MPSLAMKPRPMRRRSYLGALPYTDAIQQQIIDAAGAGAITGTLTAQLRALGYTMAEISQLYNQASSTATLTPQILQYLQTENGYLQQQLNDQNKTWMWLGAGVLVVYLLTTPAR
jgi:hypothetical protein